MCLFIIINRDKRAFIITIFIAYSVLLVAGVELGQEQLPADPLHHPKIYQTLNVHNQDPNQPLLKLAIHNLVSKNPGGALPI